MAGLPEGTLTFMLTDLVGSTRAWESAPAAMRQAMAAHDRIVDRCLKQHHGTDVPSARAGDSILAVFAWAAARPISRSGSEPLCAAAGDLSRRPGPTHQCNRAAAGRRVAPQDRAARSRIPSLERSGA